MEEERDEDMEMVIRPRNVAWNKMKMPFMFLPYRIFAEWTNIAELIKKNEAKDDVNSPTDIQIENRTRTIHRKLHEVSWALLGLDRLKFTYSTEQKLT